jgi:purine-nucleoside phosphorylase
MIPTPHLEAKKGEIAQTVLMPGDPLRAKFIAENFLTNAVCYNTVRGMFGYTGEYEGVRVSVQGSGMGVPSMGIYSYELYHFYDVQNIIRIGTAGTICDGVDIRDIVIAMGACTDSNYAGQFNLSGTFAPIADFGLLAKAAYNCKQAGLKFSVGNVITSDRFYNDDVEALLRWRDLGVLAVEMECAALYTNAARAGKNALCILTISDSIITGDSTTSEERQTAFTDMMKVALNTACL